MAEKESGWTREFPKVDGAYYTRLAGDTTDLTLVRVEKCVVHEFGVAVNFGERDYEDCEWLGPICASDAVQLSELRRVSGLALSTLRLLIGTLDGNCQRGMAQDAESIAGQLHQVLNSKQPETKGRQQ